MIISDYYHSGYTYTHRILQELNDIYQNMNTASIDLSYRDGWLNVKIKLFLYFYRVDLILNVFKWKKYSTTYSKAA
jgi:hypothetical protein